MPGPDNWCQPSGSDPAPEAPRQPIPDLISNLCAKGWRPLMLTGLLRDLLTRHFQAKLVEDTDLRGLIWRPDEKTDILIESIHRWRGELTEKRPAILLKRNTYQNQRFGIADRVGADERGMIRYSTFWVGSHTVFCIHGTGAGVEILATEVQRELTEFADEVRQALGLKKWSVTEVGAIAEVEEARESFVVPITVGWAYEQTWTLERESPKLRRITLSTLLDL